MRRVFVCFFAGTTLLAFAPAVRGASATVEVVGVSGIVDAPVERAIKGTIAEAERNHAQLVVVQIDSRGAVGTLRVQRIADRIRRSKVPVLTWVGPAGARAEDGAAVIVLAGGLRAMSDGAAFRTPETFDLRERRSFSGSRARTFSASQARRAGLVQFVEPGLDQILTDVHDVNVFIDGRATTLTIEVDRVALRFHNLDLFGRVLHAAAQPSITYLLLLLALVGIVFEAFHPSNGPAGVSGLLALALSAYGVITLGGSWIGFALVCAGVVAFCIDLRYATLGLPTAAGFVGLVAGSILLFRSPLLRISLWVLAFGVVAMVMFLLGAMTRVLRDLRALARGEIEVKDAHPLSNGRANDQMEGGHDDDS